MCNQGLQIDVNFTDLTEADHFASVFDGLLIDSAAGPDDISALWSWLAAGRVPGGPDLDSRLRWQILLRLTVLGAASRAEIEHDADRDATAAGRALVLALTQVGFGLASGVGALIALGAVVVVCSNWFSAILPMSPRV